MGTHDVTKRDEREAIERWIAESSRTDIVLAARPLLALSQPVVVRAALSALRALLAQTQGDPWVDPAHSERAGLLAEAVEAWLARPDAESLALVRTRTGGVERMWNDLSGDTGQPEPTLEAATNTGWTVIHPTQSFNLVPALGGAAKSMGAERVLTAVREGLARTGSVG